MFETHYRQLGTATNTADLFNARLVQVPWPRVTPSNQLTIKERLRRAKWLERHGYQTWAGNTAADYRRQARSGPNRLVVRRAFMSAGRWDPETRRRVVSQNSYNAAYAHVTNIYPYLKGWF